MEGLLPRSTNVSSPSLPSLLLGPGRAARTSTTPLLLFGRLLYVHLCEREDADLSDEGPTCRRWSIQSCQQVVRKATPVRVAQRLKQLGNKIQLLVARANAVLEHVPSSPAELLHPTLHEVLQHPGMVVFCLTGAIGCVDVAIVIRFQEVLVALLEILLGQPRILYRLPDGRSYSLFFSEPENGIIYVLAQQRSKHAGEQL